MLEKIKILVVSSLMAEYKNIKGILNPLKAFELDNIKYRKRHSNNKNKKIRWFNYLT